jgi:hypothetical protein
MMSYVSGQFEVSDQLPTEHIFLQPAREGWLDRMANLVDMPAVP